jgi:4-hydroxy-4-methyl-2-oxoglutarate aldolase
VNGTVRDLAQVRKLGYPLFGTHASPVGVTGKKEPKHSQIPLDISGVAVRPGDIIFAYIDGVVVIPKERPQMSRPPPKSLGALKRVAATACFTVKSCSPSGPPDILTQLRLP